VATYATVADFEAYVIGWVTEDAAALERHLEEAENYIDMAVGHYGPVDQTTGKKFVPAQLEVWRRTRLANATCAQAEYLMQKGNTFFVEEVPEDPTGPDGGQKGREPYLSPKARRELSLGQLFRLTGVSQIPFPNQNVDDYVP
jgi:hypothetical protein